MNFRVLNISALTLVSLVSATAFEVAPAAATPTTVTFNFDNMGGTAYNTSGQDASSNQISSYMTAQLQKISKYATKTITVTGAIGEQGADSYTGDDHVVGPTESVTKTVRGHTTTTTTVYPLTLANTNGLVNPKDTTKWDGAANNSTNPPVLSNSNPDGFIKNCSDITSIDPKATSATASKGCYDNPNIAGDQASPDIFINFNGLKIVSFSFDFEIFPDGTCPSLNNCPSLPDLEIWSGDNGTGTHFGTFTGVVPGASPPLSCDSVTSDKTYKNSVDSGSGTSETAPQLICHATYTVSNFTSGSITTLDFMDWPETIGIDNLTVTLPEARSIAVFVLGLLGLGLIVRRKRGSWTLFAGAKEA